MPMNSMEQLLLEELRDIYSAERLATRAYPRIRKALQTQSLQQAVERHLEQTKEQIERLGTIFETMEAKTRGKTCHAMQGLIEEAQEHMEADLNPELLEVVLLSDLQKIEHYEIAAYGSARAHAEALGLDDAVDLLEATLEEEKETDSLLNRIAVEEVNPQAVEETADDEEQSGERGREERGQEKSGGTSRRPSASRQSATAGKSGATDDLKSREYTDSQGDVHHHTRTSQAQSRG